MFDGPIGANEMNDKARAILRQMYVSRLVDDGREIPKNMRIQGIDVIDPSLSRVDHQIALTPKIDAIIEKGGQPCIVIFKPKTPSNYNSAQANFDEVKDPSRYAVVDKYELLTLLGRPEQNTTMRNKMMRDIAKLTA